MSDFKTLKECLADGKGSFKAVVISEGELKGGTTNGRDWTRKTYTIQDSTAETEITAFNEEINLLKVGYKYEFTNPWWSTYNGKTQLKIGDYCKLNLIGSSDTQTTMDSVGSRPAPESTTNNEQHAESRPSKTPEPNPNFAEFIESESLMLLQIEKIVTETMLKFSNEKNSQKIGMFVKEIYRESKKTNFVREKS